MRYPFAIAAGVLVFITTAAFAAEPVGTYTVEGTNPGSGSKYSGTATVEKTGETYRVIWVVGGDRYIGTAIGDHNFLGVSYKAGKDTGLALYAEDGGNWVGVWTYSNGRELGSEIWKRK